MFQVLYLHHLSPYKPQEVGPTIIPFYRGQRIKPTFPSTPDKKGQSWDLNPGSWLLKRCSRMPFYTAALALGQREKSCLSPGNDVTQLSSHPAT